MGFSFLDVFGGRHGTQTAPPMVQNMVQTQQAAQQSEWDKNVALQKEFAQNGIQWKVEDAKKAGIHPLAALGASTQSFSPISVGGDASGGVRNHGQELFGSLLSGLGQNIIGSAIQTATMPQRLKLMENMQLQKATLDLDNQQIQNQILLRTLQGMNNPAMPVQSNSGLGGLVSGQGNSYPTGSGYVEERPLQRTHSAEGRPNQEVGHVADVGWTRTKTGLAPVPSKDVKEKIEDQLIPEMAWAARNLVLPNVANMLPKGVAKYTGLTPDKPSATLLPPGYDGWSWSYAKQEYQPVKKSAITRTQRTKALGGHLKRNY